MFYISMSISMSMSENANFQFDSIRLINIESNRIKYFDHRVITITHIVLDWRAEMQSIHIPKQALKNKLRETKLLNYISHVFHYIIF